MGRINGRLRNDFTLIAVLLFAGSTLSAQQPGSAKSGGATKPPDKPEIHGHWLGEVAKSRHLQIIIAEHVLLSDKHIVTWEQVVKEIKKRRAAAPQNVEFYLTNGVYRSKEHGFGFWQDRIAPLYRDGREPLAVTYASISFRKAAILDKIRTDADLQPDPARKRIGVLLSHDGKPVDGAQVVVVPDNAFMMLDGFELGDPLNEQWAWSDHAGRFTVYPEAGNYWIVAIHPTGFVYQRGSDKIAPLTLQLQPWAVLTVTGTREFTGQRVSIVDCADTTPRAPNFNAYSTASGDPIQFRIPAGRIDIQRDAAMKDGRFVSTPVKTITLQPGERRTVSLVHAENAAATSQPSVNAASHGQWLGDVVKSRDPQIVIAEHVLLHDNQIVTWGQVVDGFKKTRPFRAEFYFTNAGAQKKKQGWQFWHDRIMRLYRQNSSPNDITVGIITPRKAKLFDKIRTEADLLPDPARKRIGVVLGQDGKPIDGAQVVVVPANRDRPVMLDVFELRDPLDEQWEWSDKHGKFAVYPESGECWIAAIHPTGFVCQRGSAKDPTLTLRLKPWAAITLLSTGDVAGQSTTIIDSADNAPEAPQFAIFDLTKNGDPVGLRIPAGAISVQRSFEMKNGESISVPAQKLTLHAGERKTFATTPVPAGKPKSTQQLTEWDFGNWILTQRLSTDCRYRLERGESVRRISPPASPARPEWYGSRHWAGLDPFAPGATTLGWSAGKLVFGDFGGITTDDSGFSVAGVLDYFVDTKPQWIDAPAGFLEKHLLGDWVVREDATQQERLVGLTRILRAASLPVQMEFRIVKRQVLVATLSGSKANWKRDIQIYAKDLASNEECGGGAGTYDEFLEWLGRQINLPIVSDIKLPPKQTLSWSLHRQKADTKQSNAEDRDPALVLPNITAQAGLEFHKEVRPIRILFISREK